MRFCFADRRRRSFMGKYNRNQSSPPPGGLHFPSLHLSVTPERQTADWPSCLKTQPDSNACQPASPTRAAALPTRMGGTTPPRCPRAERSRSSTGIARASALAAGGAGVLRGRDQSATRAATPDLGRQLSSHCDGHWGAPSILVKFSL
ncbi:uncharacterized protein LOC100589563 isoform X1 [Nomascus leucogenys]|uniref:uncharacterized protein LOC100589563 isoform X1 n=2 Tax=Nomascus leucogenys TaxID=61853 RepID=UPI00062A5CF9|nr:uncharacterized protein LOC100589563 isoform X1 [Nomascus leucogenys]